MGKTGILTQSEKNIHNKAYREISKLIGSAGFKNPIAPKRIIQSDLKVKKGAKQAVVGIDDIYKISMTLTQLYLELQSNKETRGSENTHKLITSNAFGLIGYRGDKKKMESVIESSAGPDRHPKTIALMMEGHFYGEVKTGVYGNYLPRIFDDLFLRFIDRLNDIDETAKKNFIKYYNAYNSPRRNLESLGWALHYIQDLTEPHHAGNYAMFFSFYTDGFDTHYAFEKKARSMINDDREFFTERAKTLLPGLEREFIAGGIHSFSDVIYQKTRPFINDNIKGNDKSAWAEVIKDALPLAIAATAIVLKNTVI